MAYAYATLNRLLLVIRRGQLSGLVRLQQPDEKEERYWATLSALSGSQAVLDEHFSEDDVAEMADAVAFASPGRGLDVTFALDRLETEYIAPLFIALERAEVAVERAGIKFERHSEG